MLPSSQRLSRQQVTALLSNPDIQVVFNRTGTLKYCIAPKQSEGGLTQITIVTGSKQQKKAVLRNKARRRLYSIFDLYQKEYPTASPISGIVYISKHVYDMSYQEIKDTFYALLSKIKKNT